MNQLSTTTNPTKTTTKSISQQPNRVKFQNFKTKELKRKNNLDPARLHHLQAEIDMAPSPPGRDRHGSTKRLDRPTPVGFDENGSTKKEKREKIVANEKKGKKIKLK